MIEQTGTVVAVEDGFAWVESERTSTCQSCSAKKGCGTSLLDNAFGSKSLAVKTLNTYNTRVGDEVVIGINESTLVRSSVMMYFVPLLSMFVFAYLAEAVFILPELFVVLSGLMGLITGFIAVRHASAKVSRNVNYQPVILKVLNAGVHLEVNRYK